MHRDHEVEHEGGYHDRERTPSLRLSFDTCRHPNGPRTSTTSAMAGTFTSAAARKYHHRPPSHARPRMYAGFAVDVITRYAKPAAHSFGHGTARTRRVNAESWRPEAMIPSSRAPAAPPGGRNVEQPDDDPHHRPRPERDDPRLFDRRPPIPAPFATTTTITIASASNTRAVCLVSERAADGERDDERPLVRRRLEEPEEGQAHEQRRQREREVDAHDVAEADEHRCRQPQARSTTRRPTRRTAGGRARRSPNRSPVPRPTRPDGRGTAPVEDAPPPRSPG